MYARPGDGELKTVEYLRNDPSNCFLPMVHEQERFGKKQRNREMKSREKGREKEKVVKVVIVSASWETYATYCRKRMMHPSNVPSIIKYEQKFHLEPIEIPQVL